MLEPMSKPIAVLISDIHYNINTLEVADKAMRLAIGKANELEVPLIVCGDLHDTKAHLRGECVKTMIETFESCLKWPYVVVGNHDRLNEKNEKHALNFLKPYASVIESPTNIPDIAMVFPYDHDVENLKKLLKKEPANNRLIMHQGIQGSNSGEYFQDKSALRPEDVAGFRVISGHYHTRQTIALPDGGQWDYVGNPFTLGFGEANDPPKGFQVLYDDGSLEFIPTNLRKHVVIEARINETTMNMEKYSSFNKENLVWFKLKGPENLVRLYSKKQIGETFFLPENFKLELIPDEQIGDIDIISISQTKEQVLDGLIDSLSNTTVAQKQRLKAAWKDFV